MGPFPFLVGFVFITHVQNLCGDVSVVPEVPSVHVWMFGKP